ncbi:ATP-binding protein [Tepidibacter thalassicus]|uniref:DNA replication protein DnaC n=1 Tax=Tepidibacter thalassicus DSM 15285 TaxID=1123350 RepID=A0A1M5TNU4_9FIRM|nr:ATP-binding protein [Tepidibacter thalassicus]SHH52350.1 DNA replication protein DnaC [Tepidibacter thalassicus DSM 15285]
MNEAKLREILLKYERIRDNAKFNLEVRKNKIYKKIPRIKEIDDKIFQIGLSLSKAVLMSPEKREEIIQKAKIEMNKLKKEKNHILTTNNIPLDYLEIKYKCEKCKDTGFIKNGIKCDCLKQELINNAYKISNLSKMVEKENFNHFDINLFSDKKSDDEEISPRENMWHIYSICENFILNFDENNDENLLFYGNTGLGKTFMCSCIAKELLDKGKIVIYKTAYDLIEVAKSYKFEKQFSSTDKENYKILFECDLLIIDDLGTEIINTFSTSEIFNIINSRLIENKKTIISTNLSPAQIASTYTERIFSRLISYFRMLRFIGEDIR